MSTARDIADSAATINYIDNVTSDVQAQIDNFSASPKLDATASGAISDGDAVIINSDGTVSNIAEAAGTADNFDANNLRSQDVKVVYDSSNNKIVVVYNRDANDELFAVVGTVSGTSVTYGTPVSITTSSQNSDACFDSVNNKIVVTYKHNGNASYGTAVVGTVSGNSISFGSATVFESSTTDYFATVFDTSVGKVLTVYQAAAGMKAAVGTVSGTSISFGTPQLISSANVYNLYAAYDSNASATVVVFRDNTQSFYQCARVFTVSGTTPSFGALVIYESSVELPYGIAFDANVNKTLNINKSSTTSGFTARVGTVSGTSISFGSSTDLGTAFLHGSVAYDATEQKMIVAYSDQSVNLTYLTRFATGTISGTSVSFVEGPSVANSGKTTRYHGIAYDASAGVTVTAYKRFSDGGYSNAFDASVTNVLTDSNFIGFSNGNYADASTATVQLVGSIDDAQTGLTAGTKYYVNTDATLGSDTSQPYAGVAISATEIIIKG